MSDALIDVAAVTADQSADDQLATKNISMWRKLGPQFWISVGWIMIVVITGLTASWLPIQSPTKKDYRALRKGPSVDHWFGTDGVGQDVFARVVHGSRVSLAVGLFSVLIALVVGGGLGLLAGYFRRRTEAVVMTAADGMLAFPALVLLLTLTTFMGATLRNVIIAIGIVMIPSFIRLARANTLAYSQREFVLAARATGARNRRIILREVLPNVILPLMAFSLIIVSIAIVAEGSLSFLGMSVDPRRTPTWGNIIASGRGDLDKAAHVVFFPAAVMFITVLAFNLAGDRLREVFDLKEGAL